MANALNKVMVAIAFAVAVVTGGGAMAATGHDFTFEKIEGGAMPMAQFKGKAVLVVNTASFCGYTPQYEGLQALWTQYKDKGLVVVGVPANNFGEQEPGTAAEIKTFCESKYDVDFPMTDKVDVVGAGAHPFYAWARDSFGAENVPKWNFHKYLMDGEGRIVAAFASKVKPDSAELKAAVEKVLPR